MDTIVNAQIEQMFANNLPYGDRKQKQIIKTKKTWQCLQTISVANVCKQSPVWRQEAETNNKN